MHSDSVQLISFTAPQSQPNKRVSSLGENFDAVVIGSGIIGAACAYWLTKAGLKVCVVEMHSTICAGTSRACDGFVSVWDKLSEAAFELSLMSERIWMELSHELPIGFDYRRCGHLLISTTEDGMHQLNTIWERMRSAGEPAELLSVAEVRSIVKGVGENVLGGLLLPNEAQLDPRKATLALLKAAELSGAKISVRTPAFGFLMSDGKVRGVKTTDVIIGCETVVVAAGVWTKELLGKAIGIRLPIEPRKGHVLVLERPSFVIPHPMAEVGYIGSLIDTKGLQVAFILEQTAEGTILLGSSREFGKSDTSTSIDVVREIAKRAVSLMPILKRLLVIRTYAGLRPWTPDMKPIIGKFGGLDGLLVATGHEGGGVCMAPGTGWLIAGLVCGGELPKFADSFSPNRFMKRDGQ